MAYMGLYENYIEHARITERILRRRRNVCQRNMEMAFGLPDAKFVSLYRLNKDVCRDLIRELEPYLPTTGSGIATASKVLSALHFFASGSHQKRIAASAHNKMHQASVSNCIKAVTLALNNEYFRRKYIRFPQTQIERKVIKQRFKEKFGMPGVLGCIDSTHIAIVKPSENEQKFLNQQQYHSLNAQIVCDSDLNILSVDASYGGATHESFIWQHHALKSHLECLQQAENEAVWFLGDSAYNLQKTLMTPIVSTEPNSPQRYYTELHSLTWNTVARCVRVLKSRWQCLLVDRKLHYHPTTAGFITNACVVLHNIANAAKLPVPELKLQDEQYETTMQIMQHDTDQLPNNDLPVGELVRNALIARLDSSITT